MKYTNEDMTQEEVLEMHKSANYLQINEKEFADLANEVEKLRKMNSNRTLYPTHVMTTTSPNHTIWKTTEWDNMGPTEYFAYVFGVVTASSEGLTISQDVYPWRTVKKYGLKVILLMWLFKNGIKNKNPLEPSENFDFYIKHHQLVTTNYPQIPYTATTGDSPPPSITWTVSGTILGQEVTYNNTVE